MKKYYIGILTSILCITSVVNASDRNVYNKIDNKAKSSDFAHGWNFYDDNNNSQPENSSKIMLKTKEKNVVTLLQKILDENKKQTKIQEEIKKMLQSELDPQPEVITLPSGKECIANSSAECYKMPITNEAKKIPVLVAFMKDPENIEKAAAYAKWQAKHLQKAFDGGQSLQYSTLQYGDKSYDLPVYGTGFTNSNGASSSLLKNKIEKGKLFQYKDKYNLKIFVGLNADMDILAFNNYMNFLKIYIPKNNYQIVFLNKDAKKVWDMMGRKFKTHTKFYNQEILKHSVINSKMFDDFQIYTSPTLAVVFNKKGKERKEARIVAVGSGSNNGFASSILKMLELQKVIPNNKDAGYRNWLKYSDVAYGEMKNRFNIEIDKDMIERIKTKQRKRENIFDKERQDENK